MAVGFSGSNGGILDRRKISEPDIVNRPLEVSYFVNNRCNLRCNHCYVGYEEKNGELSVQDIGCIKLRGGKVMKRLK